MTQTVRFMDRPIQRDDRGATAIEYALIAGLLGLGIVASLLTTKSSLNAVFGTASSQMDAGSGGSASVVAGPVLTGTSTSPRSSYWMAKTLAASPVVSTSGAVKTTVYQFTDGSMARLSVGNGGVYDSRLMISDPSTNPNANSYYYADTGGNPSLYQVNYLNLYGQVSQAVFADRQSGDTFTGVVPNRQHTNNYTYATTSPTSGVSSSSGSVATATTSFVQGANVMSQDYDFFKNLK